MKARKIINVLSIGVIIGFFVGFLISFYHIVANRYIQYQMFRLAAFNFQNFLNNYVLVTIIVSIALFIILSLLWKQSSSYMIGVHIKDKNKLKIFLVCVVCSIFFFYSGWAINHYWLPYRFHPISLLGDVGILLFTIFLGWVLIKVKWENIFKVLKVKYIRRMALILAITLVILNLGIFIDGKINAPKGPNVIMILGDALRKDRLGCYGYKRDTTPNIDSFAKNATLFKNAFAQSSSTKPSIASLFTSRYPSQHNTIYNEDALNLNHITLAEVLRENNYLTAGFIENSAISRVFNYNQGFGSWELDDRRDKKETDVSMADFDRKIFTWLNRHYKQSFFLYIHYIDPHDPYNAPEPFNNFFDKDYKGEIRGTNKYLKNKQHFYENKIDLEHLISLYDDEIRYIDSRFKEFIRKLEQLNILDDSIIIFLSDHGEGFLEHGSFYHSYSVYSELINIPLIIRYPKLFKKRYEEKYVQQIDIFPTIMHILRIPSNSLSLEGNNILSGFNKDIKIVSEHLRKDWVIPQRCVIYKNWKLIQDIYSGTYSLFNIKGDPLDHKNLIEENTALANKLKFYLSEWQKNLQDKKEASKVRLDRDLKEKFRSLGYIQ